VYVARDPSLGRKVAIKLLPVRLSGDKETLARFTREARSASALNHPNIVTIHEVGMDQGSGSPYIVMEYIDGRDLRSLLSNGPLPNRKTLDIAAQIADGLAAAHEQGIVHRDLKPENVMVTKDGYVKVLDFGLAKIIRPAGEDDDTAQLDMPGTNPGTILGTVGYMSPEQATGKPLDFRSDQFAFGAILYELATGKPAFEAENAIDTLSAILHEEPAPITKFNGQAPQPFCWIVDRLLSKDVNERYSSTRDLARDLRNIRDRFATMTRTTDDIPRPPKVSRQTITIAASVLAALLLVGGVAVIARRGATAAPAESQTASKKYLAVMPFRDLTNQPNGQLVVDGLAETLSARLAHFTSVQVMRPAAADAAAANGDPKKVGHDLGANIVLTGSMQRAGDRLRVAYEVVDLAQGTSRPGDLIEGSASDLFTIQDKLADSIAASLQLGAPAFRASVPDSSVSQTRYLEALGHLRRYDKEASVDSAIHILEELAAQSSSASVQAALGRAYLAKFELTHDAKWEPLAAVACQRAIANDPQNPDTRVTLGELRRLTGQLDDATREYKAALAQQPNNADAILGLAETYKADGKLQEAETSYKRSIELQPNYWAGYNRLGAFYFAHVRYAEAAEMFSKVVQLQPDNQRGYNNLGGMYFQMGRYDEALRVFLASIGKEPTAQGYSNVGTANYFLRHYSDAANAFERATQLAPTNYLYWSNLGDAYRWTAGGTVQSNVCYDRAIQLADGELKMNPTNTAVRARLAVCLAKRGSTKRADDEIRAALATDPTNPTYTYKAAMIANIEGRTEDALRLFGTALSRGYGRAEIEHDPEFDNLKHDGRLQKLVEQTATMPSGSAAQPKTGR
ncbi:MAG: eukaryotic-like serine/threonine-protein kinase, partial [Thermoanaerobaculia bacterium]|nr:eukaryotic-like serine/threonine-protein kinase [Thermoanaerobaculia bacterium]